MSFHLKLKEIYTEEEHTTIVDTEEEIVSISIGSASDEDGNPQTVVYAFNSNVEIHRENGTLSLDEVQEIIDDFYEFTVEEQ